MQVITVGAGEAARLQRRVPQPRLHRLPAKVEAREATMVATVENRRAAVAKRAAMTKEVTVAKVEVKAVTEALRAVVKEEARKVMVALRAAAREATEAPKAATKTVTRADLKAEVPGGAEGVTAEDLRFSNSA